MSVTATVETPRPANGLYSPDDLLTLRGGDQYELVDGQLKERSMGWESSWVGGTLFGLLFGHCRANDLGWVAPADAGYQCFPNRPNLVRKPDVSFVRRGRFAEERFPSGFAKLAPDLAVEVVSPNDFTEETMEKVQNYHGAGVRLVWVIYPRNQVVEIYRLDGTVALLMADQELSGEDVVPGFACRVRDILPPHPAGSQ